MSLIVPGDRDRLSQVFTNLIGNIVRYTPAGSPVEIALGLSGDTAIVELRDHVRTTFFSFFSLSASIFFIRLSATKGPFLIDLDKVSPPFAGRQVRVRRGSIGVDYLRR